MPGLQVRQDGDDLLQRMRGRVGQERVGGGAFFVKELLQVEPEDFVGLLWRPAGSVREQLDEEIRHHVAQRAADPCGVCVGFEVLRERGDPELPERRPLAPDLEIGALRLREDLLARPGRKIHCASRLDALAARNLPGIRACVGRERLRVEEIECGAWQRAFRPRLLLEKPDCSLVAVEADRQLRLPHESPRPFGFVSAPPRRGKDLLHAFGRLLELLFRGEPVHFFPTGRRGRLHGLLLVGGLLPRRLPEGDASAGPRQQEQQERAAEKARRPRHGGHSVSKRNRIPREGSRRRQAGRKAW